MARIAELIKAVGLKHELWEIRTKARDGIARAIYITATGWRVVILHAFVKETSKTPASDLDIARRRLREMRP